MKVFKFGGASIRNAGAIRNMAEILSGYDQKNLVVVVSAMGKTTNALEKILALKSNGDNCTDEFSALCEYHQIVCSELDLDHDPYKSRLSSLFDELERKINSLKVTDDYNFAYDQIVSNGELISSTIITSFLNSQGITTCWSDARKLIRTDNRFREASIDWESTKMQIQRAIPDLANSGIILTQGFIGGTLAGDTTTLGREGSDFTGAIFSYCLDAESLTIWKDVPGILNADPKRVTNTKKFKQLSYQEAAEMTYYGASVIHPKTIKPLANKSIPLHVKSFDSPQEEGTVIDEGEKHKLYPALIFKDNQVLISFQVKDLAFIDERNLSIIFHVLDKLNIKINVMQNSAVSLSICINDEPQKINELINTLQYDFRILYNKGLLLTTVKNYDQATIDDVSFEKNILLEQRTRNTYQIVMEAN
ncbi:aspartate kinase [Bacteroidota bacterium]